MSLLEIKKLTYETNGKKILDGFSLTVEASEVHAVLGTNGAGKSTLAFLIMGCEGYRPTSGEIIFGGNIINELRMHKRAELGISMSWQEPVRFEGIAVKDYLTLKNKHADPSPCLELVGLQPELYLDRMVDRSLSGGERKRIELASILTLSPRLAVLDEPDSGIDMLSTKDIINVINVFKKNGLSVLLITHREEIAMIADKASLLCWGKMVCSGNPQMVAEYYKSRECLRCYEKVCENV